MSTTITTILIGNPGVGKSTMLNCLLGRVGEFHAGVSFGGGLTKILQIHENPDGNRFIDTPGLSDATMRQQAAIEIEKALKTGGTFKIFFVLTLEAGRVRPDDKTTIQLVLASAPQIGDKYSIIINKLPIATLKKLKNNEHDRVALVTNLNEGLEGTTSIYYNIKIAELEDAENEIAELDQNFLDFVMFSPTITITKENVTAIEFDKFEQVKEMLSAQLEAMKKDNELMRKKMEEQEERFRRERKEQEERYMREKREQEERFQADQERYRQSQEKLVAAQEQRRIEDQIRFKVEQEKLLREQEKSMEAAEKRYKEEQQRHEQEQNRIREEQAKRYKEEQERHKQEQELIRKDQTKLLNDYNKRFDSERKQHLEREKQFKEEQTAKEKQFEEFVKQEKEKFEKAQQDFIKQQNNLLASQNNAQAELRKAMDALLKDKNEAEARAQESQRARAAAEGRSRRIHECHIH